MSARLVIAIGFLLAAAGGAGAWKWLVPGATVEAEGDDLDSAGAACCEADEATTPAATAEILAGGVTLPDVELTDQNGRKVKLASDVVGDKIVAINFVFTTCRTVCPPMGANYVHLQKLLGERLGRDVALVSVSVDPVTDTPERLRAWSEQFDPSPHWTLLTGTKQDIDGVLTTLEVFTADKTEHSPFVLVGDPAAGAWRRIHGLSPPRAIADVILEMADRAEEREAEPAESASSSYFAGIELVDQNGRAVDLHRDLIRGKVVVVHSFFASCTAVCPQLLSTAVEMQNRMGDRLGVDAHILSITVDPDNDTPERLKELALGLDAAPGWYFLTGSKAQVDHALQKIGQYTEFREGHSNVFIMGNDRTNLWKKVQGLADPKDVLSSLSGVLEDGG